MSVYGSNREFFYDRIKCLDDISSSLKEVLASEDNGFYEVCRKFSDIGLNSLPIDEKESIIYQRLVNYEDIDEAKIAFVKFVNNNNIEDIKILLNLVHNNHKFATEWDDKREKYIQRINTQEQISCSKIYNLANLPDEVWNRIESEILEIL